MFRTIHWSLGGSSVGTQLKASAVSPLEFLSSQQLCREGPSLSLTDCCQAPSCAGHCRKPQCWGIMPALMCRGEHSQLVSLSPGSYIHALLSPSAMFPKPLRGGGINVQFRAEHSTVPYSQHLEQTCVSAFTGNAKWSLSDSKGGGGGEALIYGSKQISATNILKAAWLCFPISTSWHIPCTKRKFRWAWSMWSYRRKLWLHRAMDWLWSQPCNLQTEQIIMLLLYRKAKKNVLHDASPKLSLQFSLQGSFDSCLSWSSGCETDLKIPLVTLEAQQCMKTKWSKPNLTTTMGAPTSLHASADKLKHLHKNVWVHL